MTTPDTIVHLLRHGEVHNPEGILYGRRDGFHLSALGNRLAARIAASIIGQLPSTQTLVDLVADVGGSSEQSADG